MANVTFKDAFADIYADVSQTTAMFESVAINKSIKAYDSALSLTPGPQEEYKIQRLIRPYYGKAGINTQTIGTPPCFSHLEHNRNNTEQHYIVTLFVDIKGSTRLSLLYSIEDVYQFKNAVIQTCIETIRALDGHVHRIMGDAVMAFFGNKDTAKEDAIADAINCAITLRVLLESSIKPWMKKKGWKDEDFGFRIGMDYGRDEEVLWGAYGYAGVSEVTATGLPVDMASKLQSLANKNETMLGQGILDFVNWPDEYSKLKTVIKQGENIDVEYVTPNLTTNDGRSLDYRMRLLHYKKTMKYSALPTEVKAGLIESRVINNNYITFECFTILDDQEQAYLSASRFLEKEVELTFKVTANTKMFQRPLTVRLTKINHGIDVPEEERDLPSQYEDMRIVATASQRFVPNTYKSVSIPETTLYRGLHTIECTVYDANGKVQYRNWIGVLIK